MENPLRRSLTPGEKKKRRKEREMEKQKTEKERKIIVIRRILQIKNV